MEPRRDSKKGQENSRFARRVLIVIGLAALAFIAWQLRSVLLLLFGAILVATIVRAGATPLQKHLHVPERPATILSFLLIAAVIGASGWLLSTQLTQQTQALAKTLPNSIANLDRSLASIGLNHPIDAFLAQLQSRGGSLVARFAQFASWASEALASFLIVVSGGVFLATQPSLYRAGIIKLVPSDRRALVSEALDDCEHALRLWLKGQLIAMLVIGAMTAAGLWLLGIPSWLVLGIIAGFFEFIPFAGPILSAVPAVLIALLHSPELALWTALMYFVVQHAESYLIQPIIQQVAVEIPAVVLLFSLLAFATLFGPIGILFAAPMTVVTYVLVKRLYVIEALDTPTPIPGENKP